MAKKKLMSSRPSGRNRINLFLLLLLPLSMWVLFSPNSQLQAKTGLTFPLDTLEDYVSIPTILSKSSIKEADKRASYSVKRCMVEESACRRIATCAADAEQLTNGNNLIICNNNDAVSDLELGELGGNANQVALNFGNWNIPQGQLL